MRTKTTSPQITKRDYNSLTNVTPARNFPTDHKGGIWGLASLHNVMEVAQSPSM